MTKVKFEIKERVVLDDQAVLPIQSLDLAEKEGVDVERENQKKGVRLKRKEDVIV